MTKKKPAKRIRWIKFTGTTCPVDPMTVVRIKRRSGDISINWKAKDITWDFLPNPVTAYYVIKPVIKPVKKSTVPHIPAAATGKLLELRHRIDERKDSVYDTQFLELINILLGESVPTSPKAIPDNVAQEAQTAILNRQDTPSDAKSGGDSQLNCPELRADYWQNKYEAVKNGYESGHAAGLDEGLERGHSSGFWFGIFMTILCEAFWAIMYFGLRSIW